MSRQFEWSEFTLNIDKKSIAGFSAFSKQVMNIKSLDDTENLYGISYNRSFDYKIAYKSVNMLVIPMLNYENDVVGVLQLINKKKHKYILFERPEDIEDEIIPFSEEEEEVIESLSAQAGILIERTILHDEIQELLSSFISAMVRTIDARDITTSGHSRRLAGYALHFIKTLNNVNYGKYADTKFSDDDFREIYYAALLHDIGKIGVEEAVLLKENRLNNSEIEKIKYRFKYIKLLIRNNKEYSDLYSKIDSYLNFIFSINKAGFLDDEKMTILNEIYSIEVEDENEVINLLTEEEYKNLSVRKGNLTDEERKKINDHVVHSYNILKDITWTKTLKNVPEIAGNHHEKIDGSGYPKGLKGEEICIQARILAILDIFEALTARDRPYKPPMTVEKAVSILEFEVKDKHLDPDLFEIFIKERIFDLYKEELDKIIQI
jgi:HD-GYP domain-containing protein (c-di-GMP phosphodiesterase class II)